jgi:hypothetical protein
LQLRLAGVEDELMEAKEEKEELEDEVEGL